MEPVPARNLLHGSGTVPTRELGIRFQKLSKLKEKSSHHKEEARERRGVDFSFYLVILVSRKWYRASGLHVWIERADLEGIMKWGLGEIMAFVTGNMHVYIAPHSRASDMNTTTEKAQIVPLLCIFWCSWSRMWFPHLVAGSSVGGEEKAWFQGLRTHKKWRKLKEH